MIGFDTLMLLLTGICHLVFTFLVQARVVFITNLKDCCSGWLYLLKARWFYILTTLVFVISASSVECSSLSAISCDERFTRNITGSSALHVESDSYMFNNRIVGRVMEHPIITLSSVVFNVSNRSANIFVHRYINGFTGTQLFLTEVVYGEEPTTCNVNLIPIVNVFELVSALPDPFMRNICSVSIFILKAPWFHFIILLGLLFRLFTTFAPSQKKSITISSIGKTSDGYREVACQATIVC